ncbi:MAG TPA: serine dehydratase subunit alpha family protein [bacterium]|nr:serine dehydratase subunit alpha family protein [bacterium]
MVEKIKEILKSTVKEASGCTEAVAIAIAGSAAYNSIIGNYPKTIKEPAGSFHPPDISKIEKIEIVVDKNVFKNAYGVCVPNVKGGKGIKIAACVGLFADINRYFRNPEQPGYLQLFKQIDSNSVNIEKLKSICERISLKVDFERRDLFINMGLKYGGDEAEVIISKRHDNIEKVKVNGEVYEKLEFLKRKDEEDQSSYKLTFDEVFELVENISNEELLELKEELQGSIDVNKLLVEEGLLGDYGMGVINIFKRLLKEKSFGESILTQIKLQVAGGVEARMGGTPYPAMASSGSGNMGITATMPIIVAGEYINAEKTKILKSILMSHLIVKISSDYIGELSPLCNNANKSAFGAAAGLTYLLGGDKEKVANAIKYVASIGVGLLCDGAKYDCALKAMTAATIAYEAALFAIKGIKIPSEGIVEDSVDDTLKNLGKLSDAMEEVDKTIVKIILDREKYKKVSRD